MVDPTHRHRADPRFLCHTTASLALRIIKSVSVGIFNGVPVLDLDYAEDSNAETDMNVVMNEAGQFIELQGTAEGHAFRRDELDALLALAEKGIREIMAAQQEALHG